MTRRSPITSDQEAAIWNLFVASDLSLRAIAALHGMSDRTLRRRLTEWRWPKREEARDAAKRGTTEAGAGAPLDLSAVAQALARSVLAELDRHRTALGSGPSEPDRNARALASLARTLTAAEALQRHDALRRDEADEGGGKAADDDDEPPPRSLEELRAELARQLDRLVADEQAHGGDDFLHLAGALAPDEELAAPEPSLPALSARPRRAPPVADDAALAPDRRARRGKDPDGR